MTLEAMLKALRKKDWTQQQLSAELGVAQATISKWESGKVDHFAPFDRLVALYERECGTYTKCNADRAVAQ